MDQLITSEIFKGRFLKNIPAGFQWQKTSLQIYPLSFLRNYFKLPLPIIQTDYNFLFYIKVGELKIRINNGFYSCGPESLVFVSIDNVSSLQYVSEDLKGYFVLIDNKTMSLLFKQSELLDFFMIDPVLKLKDSDCGWVHNLCKLLYQEFSSNSPNEQIGNNLVQALLNKIVQLSKSMRILSRTQLIAIQFRQLVFRNFDTEKSISFYADSLSISGNYLNRCVKSVFKKSCKEILVEVAILNSQILLINSTKSVSEICFELNFEDPSYFTRIFKSFTGLTPTEYRQNFSHGLS